jgi:anti-anti-sigma regulatory factor
MTCRFDKSGNRGVLTFSGELTVEHVGEMRTAIIQALSDVNGVDIDFSGVTNVDFLCLQLLCSVHRTSLSLNKRVNFIGSRPATFRETAETAGFSRITGCDLDREQNCFWISR